MNKGKLSLFLFNFMFHCKLHYNFTDKVQMTICMLCNSTECLYYELQNLIINLAHC
jgi:hypothetical protein